MHPRGPPPPTTISAIRGVAPPAQPVVLETRVIGLPAISPTKIIQHNHSGQTEHLIPPNNTAPSIMINRDLTASRILNNKNQFLTP
jgi:hypothetical protein